MASGAIYTGLQSGESSTYNWVELTSPSCDTFLAIATPVFGEACVAIGKPLVGGEVEFVGTGTMIALGVCVTATHVLDALGQDQPVLYAFLPSGKARVWALTRSDHFRAIHRHPVTPENDRLEKHDLSLLACELISEPVGEEPIGLLPVAMAIPAVGDRLTAYGYSVAEGEAPQMFVTSGLVTNVYPDRRDPMLPNPCVEVDMTTRAGMSGGPVINAHGRVVGVLSTSVGNHEQGRPTFVSLVWQADLLSVGRSWPESKWSWRADAIGTLKAARQDGLADIKGHAGEHPIDGRWYVETPLDLT